MTYRLSPKIINFEECWYSLRNTLDLIVHLRPLSKTEWQNGISEIHTICSAKVIINPELLLYNMIRKFIREHVRKITNDLKSACEEMLVKYNAAWDTYKRACFILNDFCCCLNKYVATPQREPSTGISTKSRKSVGNVAYSAWKRILLEELSKNLTKLAIESVKNIRNHMSQAQLDDCRKYACSLMDLNDPFENPRMQATPKVVVPKEPFLLVYEEMFEEEFIKETAIYFDGLCAEKYRDLDCSQYMKKVLQTIDEEKLCAFKYFHATTIGKIERLGYQIFVASHLDRFNSMCQFYIENDELHREDLRNMHTLLKQVNYGLDSNCGRFGGALENLITVLERHICREGTQAIEKIAAMAVANPKSFITTILQVHDRYQKLVAETFRQDPGFVQALDKACTSFINTNAVTKSAKSSSKTPELLARYSDLLLRKGSKLAEEGGTEECLSQIMVIFKYLDGKDVYQKYYSKMLAKRLVGEQSASNGAEASMISKLKRMCGFEYTHKLQRMFTDAELSKGITEEYKRHIQSQGKSECIDFSIKVLATGVWPFSRTDCFEIPAAVKESIDSFTAFYQSKHNGRKLNWMLPMGKGELASHCFDRKFIFTASTPQMSILMLYNDSSEYTLEKMTTILKMPQDQVIAHLQVIVKLEVIKVTPGCFELASNAAGDTILRLNDSFNSKRMKVDLSKVPMRGEVKKENDEVQKSVDDDRCIVVQAALVRIMKTRKSLKHSQLMSEVIQQLSSRFQPKVPMIKKCIDTLIDKYYLKRVENDRDSYEYLA